MSFFTIKNYLKSIEYLPITVFCLFCMLMAIYSGSIEHKIGSLLLLETRFLFLVAHFRLAMMQSFS